MIQTTHQPAQKFLRCRTKKLASDGRREVSCSTFRLIHNQQPKLNPTSRAKTKPAVKFWRGTDTAFMLRVALIGLVGGIALRWLGQATPPQPVPVMQFNAAPTNAPAAIKSAGVSPSARD